MGFKKQAEFPYEQMQYKGERLFPTGRSFDGGRHFTLFIGEVAEMMKICKA